jgi:nickel-dependent lactate racemase
LEIATLTRHDFMLDVTLTRSREMAGIFCGDGIKAHAAGVQFLRETLLESFSEPFDAVITSAAGYPLDLTFYQTIKGVTAGQHILKAGGKILAMGECSEGVGAPEFADQLAHLTNYDSYLQELHGVPVQVDQWQLEKLALAGLKFEIFLYTPGILPHSAGGLGKYMYCSPSAAIDAFMKSLPKRARVAVIPEGPYVFAQVKEPALVEER